MKKFKIKNTFVIQKGITSIIQYNNINYRYMMSDNKNNRFICFWFLWVQGDYYVIILYYTIVYNYLLWHKFWLNLPFSDKLICINYT